MQIAPCNQWDNDTFSAAMHFLAVRELNRREIENNLADANLSMNIGDILDEIYSEWLWHSEPAGQG